MNHERRRLLVAAAFASGALNLRGSAAAAETAVPGEAPAPAAGSESGETTIALNAHVEPPAGADARLGYGGVLPGGAPRSGPIFRVKKDSAVRVRLTNNLSEATTLDWHGMRLPNALAFPTGLKGAALAPGHSSETTLRPGDSGSYWFHAGLVPGLTDQTARGLAGLLIVEEPAPPAVDQDKVMFLTDASPAQKAGSVPGAASLAASKNTLINGRVALETDILPPGARLRLRIVNGSTQQAQVVSFEGSRPLVIAIDGQPSELFAPLNNAVPVGPGARFDIMVDLPRASGAQFSVLLRGPASSPSQADQPIYRATTDGAPAAERPAIALLPPNPALPRYIPLEHSVRATMSIERHSGPTAPSSAAAWTVNGIGGLADQKKPLFSVKRNTPVTLAFQNRSRELIAIRLHGHVMRLLHAMDDGWEPYWRDSVLVPPGVTHHAAFLADNPGQWPLDSAFFEQAAGGLRTWFEVV